MFIKNIGRLHFEQLPFPVWLASSEQHMMLPLAMAQPQSRRPWVVACARRNQRTPNLKGIVSQLSSNMCIQSSLGMPLPSRLGPTVCPKP